MKKKKNALLIILAAVVAMLVMSVNVWAVQKNPLAQMSTKYQRCIIFSTSWKGVRLFHT
ncbi:MAG: hypothetical protein ACLUKE_02275 [Blautia wexlerae]